MSRIIVFLLIALLSACNNVKVVDNKNDVLTGDSRKSVLADSLYYLGKTYCEDSMNQNKALELYQKSFDIYENLGDKNKMALLYRRIGFVYDCLEDFEAEQLYFRKALKIYEELDDKKELANVLNFIGITYTLLGDIDSAVIYYDRGMEMAEIAKDTLEIIELYQNKGITYQYNGDYQKAIECHLNALKYCEDISYTIGLFDMYVNLAQDYQECGEYDLALNQIQKAEEYVDSNDKEYEKASFYHTYALLLQKKENLTDAKKYFQKTLDASHEANFRRGAAAAYSGLAEIALEEKEYKKALEFNQMSLDFEKEIKNYSGVITSLNLFAEIENEQGNYNKAIKYIKESEKLAIDEGFVGYYPDIYYRYYIVYKAMNQNDLALTYFEKYQSLNDSIASVEVKERMAELEIKYETEKKQDQIKLLNEENKAKKQKIRARNLFIVSLILLMIVILTIAYIFRQKGIQKLTEMETELQKYLLQIKDVEFENQTKSEDNTKILAAKNGLTEREAEVLQLISEGMSNAEIAEKIFVSSNTIKYHIKNIYLKLDVKNRVEALNKIKR